MNKEYTIELLEDFKIHEEETAYTLGGILNDTRTDLSAEELYEINEMRFVHIRNCKVAKKMIWRRQNRKKVR